MVLNKSEVKILIKLINLDDFISAETLADFLAISKRTVYSYITNLNNYLSQNNFSERIIMESSKGIKIDSKSKNSKNKMKRRVQVHLLKNNLIGFDRRIDIYWHLLLGNNQSYQTLSKKYNVSKSAVYADFTWLKSQYIPPEVNLISDSVGTKIQADEIVIQSEIVKIIDCITELLDFRSNDVNSIVKLINYLYPKARIISRQIAHMVNKLSEKYELPSNYKLQLNKFLIIFVARKIQGHTFTTKLSYNFWVNDNKSALLDRVLQRIERISNLAITHVEKVYIENLLISNGINFDGISKFSKITPTQIKSLVNTFSEMINVDLNSDIELLHGLENHLKLMLERLKNHQILANPYKKEIKQQYAFIFYVTSIVIKNLEEEIKINIPEEEIAFITLHFQLAYERNSRAKKVLVLSDSGVVFRELLVRRLSSVLSGIANLDSESIVNLNKIQLEKYDFIISTQMLNIDYDEIIQMSEYPSDNELEKVRQSIINNKVLDEFNGKNTFIEELISKGTVKIVDKIAGQQETIYSLVNEMNSEDIVDKDKYFDSILKRERLSSTSFENNIALPHGHSKYLKKSSISILISKTPIKWGESVVNIVILLSFTKSDTSRVSEVMTAIYNLLNSPEQTSLLMEKNTKEEVVQFIANKRSF